MRNYDNNEITETLLLFRNIIMAKRRSIKIENEITASFEKTKTTRKSR